MSGLFGGGDSPPPPTPPPPPKPTPPMPDLESPMVREAEDQRMRAIIGRSGRRSTELTQGPSDQPYTRRTLGSG